MQKISIIFFVLVFQFVSAQKFDLLERSNYTHNYQVSTAKIIESKADTVGLAYIATIRISDAHERVHKAAAWIDLIRIKTREYGANCYIVSKYEEDDVSASVTLKFYFGSLKFLERNELKQESTKAIVFNQVRLEGDSAMVYHNHKIEYFNPMTYAEFLFTEKVPETLATNTDASTSIKITFKKKSAARYFIVPASKNSIALSSNSLNPNGVIVLVGGVPISFRLNKPYELNYQTGRFLQELYRF